MRLGYDLTIEQSQKLVMTPELIQAIQILQFNTQELEGYVEEQLLTNPILEVQSASPAEGENEKPGDDEYRESYQEKNEDFHQSKDFEGDFEPKTAAENGNEFDWAEHFKEKEYDDISYKQWEYNAEKSEYTYEQFVSSEITLTEHLMFQLQFAPIKHSCRNIGRYIIESLDENGYMTLSMEEIAKEMGVEQEKVEIVLDAIHEL